MKMIIMLKNENIERYKNDYNVKKMKILIMINKKY